MRKPRVIIYDDDAMILEMLGLFFTRKGYEIYSYSSPRVCPRNEDLSDSCENLYPCADIVIADYKMPKMTGTELLQRQLKRGCKVDTKMKAIISGYADEELVARCRDLGCSFFEKPFSLPELSLWLSECEKHFDLSQPLNDRRANSRYPFKQDIEFCLHAASSQEKLIGIAFDKSDAGLGLRVSSRLPVGAEVEIIRGLEVPQQRGVVQWCSRQSENSYRAGLHLL